MKIPEPRKLKSGSWNVRVTVGGDVRSITRRTKKDCLDAAMLIKAEYKAGKLTRSTTAVTLHDAIDAYIDRRKNTLSPSTIDGYRRIQKKRFSRYANMPLASIDWQKACDEERQLVSSKTLRNAYRFVVSVMTDNGITPPKITLPTLDSRVRGWLDDDQIRRLIDAADGTSAALPVYLGLHSLRRSEMAALTWDDIDLDARTISVRGAMVQDEKHHFQLRAENKTYKSMRDIRIMIPQLYEALSAVPESERAGYIFDLNPNTLTDRINSACRAAGLPEVGAHGLRHSFASLAAHLNMSPQETKSIGGWSGEMMGKIYTHIYEKDRLAAENKIESFFSAPKNVTKNVTDSANFR